MDGDPAIKVEQRVAGTHLSLVGETGGGDSLLVEVSFDTISDPSGIDRVVWQNWGVAPPEITADTAAGMTNTTVDTMQVRKPPINSTDTYNIRVHAVDKALNQGPWSPLHQWAVVHGDTTGPLPPGIVIEDSIKIYTTVTLLSVNVWPSSIKVTGHRTDGGCEDTDSTPPCTFPALAINIYDDGGVLCTDGVANQVEGDGDRDRATPGPWVDPGCREGAVALGANPDQWAGRRYTFIDWSVTNDPAQKWLCEISYLGTLACQDTTTTTAAPALHFASGLNQLKVVERIGTPEPGSMGFYQSTR
jgi:hypothetical protein